VESESDQGRSEADVKIGYEVMEIIASLTPGVMTREEVERYREELMDERTGFTAAIGDQLFSWVKPSEYAYMVHEC
jgi:hypothetical protein